MGRLSWDAEEVLNITEILAGLAAAKKRLNPVRNIRDSISL